jgi:hypothetical protein
VFSTLQVRRALVVVVGFGGFRFRGVFFVNRAVLKEMPSFSAGPVCTPDIVGVGHPVMVNGPSGGGGAVAAGSVGVVTSEVRTPVTGCYELGKGG